MNENVLITVPEERTLGMVAMEIRTLHAQAQQVVLGYAIEIGRRLTEAKSMVSHGEWGNWLKEEVNYSKSTANNFMRIFDEYGANQQSLFGPEAKSQTLGNLPYTKALRLLSIPEEEREEFIESNHVEDLSTRELEKLIKERDEAKAAEQKAMERASVAENARDRMIEKRDELEKVLNAEAEKLREQAEAEKKKAETAAKEAEKAKADLEKAQKKADAAAEKLKKLQEQPVSEDAMEKIRAEAAAAAEKSAAEKLEEKLKEAAAKTEEAEKAAAEAKVRAEQAEKKLALADEDTILFKAQFSRFQEEFNKCVGLLDKVDAAAPETAKKLKTAMQTVLDSMKGRV